MPSKVENKTGEGKQTSQQPVPAPGGSLGQTGLLGAHPPAPPGHCSCVVTGGSAAACRLGGFLPSPASLPGLDSLEETGAGEPALHSNNNRLPDWRPLLGARPEPEATPPDPATGKTCFLVFQGGGVQEAYTHPESTRELISTDGPGQGASWAVDRVGPGPGLLLVSIPAKGQVQSQKGTARRPGCSRDKASNLKSVFLLKREDLRGCQATSIITDFRHIVP